MRHFLLVLGATLALTAFAGCGTRKPVVSGVVTLDGQALDNGTIQFFPVKGDGQTSGAVLGKDGSYQMEASPTTMKVVISSSRVVSHRKRYENVPDSPVDEIREEVVPARYSDMNKTELTFKVEPGENKKDFDLKSDREKKSP
jgi:hypothetical protein